MKLSQIRRNPNNPRIIRDEKFEKLKRSIQDFPQMMELRPIVVDEDGVILGGNMRYEAIKSLKMAEFPDEWVKRVEELTEDQKKEFIVKDNVGFGDWDWDAIANEWDELPLDDWGLNVPGFESVEPEPTESENPYTDKIVAPIYEPGEVKPAVTDLCDNSKTDELIKEISASSVPDEIKNFLVFAAQRHRVFRYDRIADFYAHADVKTQQLMEKSALVIIDFDKAMQNGYVKLTKEIEAIYAEDYANAD